MLILTDRELEFLASFNANWRRLYWDELARLLKEGDRRCDALHDARATATPSRLECDKVQLTLVA
jgi:hypothetical protein